MGDWAWRPERVTSLWNDSSARWSIPTERSLSPYLYALDAVASRTPDRSCR